MKKAIVLVLIFASTFYLNSCTKEDISTLLTSGGNELSEEEVIAALREALSVGTDTSVTILNKVNGYFADEAVKILLPSEAEVVYSRITQIPGGTELLNNTILAMNRAAEDAASEAKPIFISAITGISISDGFKILNSNETAATQYLKSNTFSALFNAFQPKINQSLSKPMVLGLSAQTTYANLIDAYNLASLNGVLWPRITSNSLSDHVTNKGLTGLFLKVGEQEMKIRKDPLAQVTELLKKVFGKK